MCAYSIVLRDIILMIAKICRKGKDEALNIGGGTIGHSASSPENGKIHKAHSILMILNGAAVPVWADEREDIGKVDGFHRFTSPRPFLRTAVIAP